MNNDIANNDNSAIKTLFQIPVFFPLLFSIDKRPVLKTPSDPKTGNYDNLKWLSVYGKHIFRPPNTHIRPFKIELNDPTHDID